MRRGSSSAICGPQPGDGPPPPHVVRIDEPRRLVAEAAELEVRDGHGWPSLARAIVQVRPRRCRCSTDADVGGVPEADRARRCGRARRRHPPVPRLPRHRPRQHPLGHGRERPRPDHGAALDRGAGPGRWPAAAPTGRLRTSWYLLAAAAVCWGLGQAVWTWFEVVLDEPVPYPGLADVGYLGAIPFLLAGVLVFPSRSLRSMGRARAVLDGLITTAAMVFASYGTFLGRGVPGERGRAGSSAASPSPTPSRTSSPSPWCSRCSRAGASALVGTAAAGRRRRRVPGGRRQRLRLHDREGHLRQRPGDRRGLAARVRAARAGGLRPDRDRRRPATRGLSRSR